ncbi:MAG TPA: FAD/NAD(P)-binding protein [Amycolatopsis sp.]|nr:FAD/NAD(P)-binding protein [Amycolatopsis sp.]
MAPAQLVIIGAGPRGVGVLERIAANTNADTGELLVHLVDPFPSGGGRIWRYDQSPLLRMNSMAEDVTMFTDETVRIEGPIRPGPSLSEWAEQVRAGELRPALSETLRPELDGLTGRSFPTRRLASAYLDWVYRRVLGELPPTVQVIEHRTRALRIDGDLVVLEGEDPLRADAVLLTVGHLDAEPDDSAAALVEFAARHGLAYYPAGYTADVDYSSVPPGEPVLVRGFGLAFVDLMLLLTEGRGGRFTEHPGGGLRYHPSGAEPVLHVGSRRGVPYHSKPGYSLQGAPLELPRFFGPDTIDALSKHREPLDFFADVWPHVAKELGWGYYSELFTGHPDKVRTDFAAFAAEFADLRWDSEEMHALVESTVPDPRDRLDLRRLDRPLTGERFDTAEEFGKHLRAYIEADLARRADPAFSADLGAFMAMLSVVGQVPALVATGRLDPASQLSDVDRWWHGFFSYFASGPPPERLAELLALHQAGVVSLLGAEMRVTPDAERGVFTGSGESFPGHVEARTLIEARLPEADVARASDDLLRSMRADGTLAEELVHGLPSGRIGTRVRDGRLLDARCQAHPRRFSVGPHTSGRSAAAFTRPRTNARPFRENDALAREILAVLFP